MNLDFNSNDDPNFANELKTLNETANEIKVTQTIKILWKKKR
jgi:hypothetical protein